MTSTKCLAQLYQFRALPYTWWVRIGSVPYLNARPLVDWLENHPQPGIELSYATPAVLVEQVLCGDLDIAMASTFPVLQHPELHLLPGLGVTTHGPAWSVRVMSRIPFAQVRSLALDSSSRSSVVLARIIFADRYQCIPEVCSLPPDPQSMLTHADAAVMIGDIGLTFDHGDCYLTDLGQEWWDLTGLPFYFAGWVARDAAVLTEAAPLLHHACDEGLRNLDDIAAREAVRLRIPYQRCFDYLADVMQYHTGEAEVAGLEEFCSRAARLGLL